MKIILNPLCDDCFLMQSSSSFLKKGVLAIYLLSLQALSRNQVNMLTETKHNQCFF